MLRFFGAHVSVAGGFASAIDHAERLGINAIQVHPSPPQRWNDKPYKAGYETAFLEAMESSKVERVFFHAIYLINLVTPSPEKLEKAKTSLKNYLDLSARISGAGVVVHVGSLVDEPDEQRGFERAARSIDEILNDTDPKARLILEVAAGAGRVVGSHPSQLRAIYDLIEQKERVGFGLDTQHMWASGFDWRNDLPGVLQTVFQFFGLEKIWCIHLNDSMTALGSRKDRHENLGKGLIGDEALRALLHREELQEIPFILETPALKSIDSAVEEVAHLKDLIAA